MHSVDNGAREPQRAALPRAVFPARPASVDEPAVDVVLRHAIGEHACVAAGVQDDERGAVARRERRDWLEHAVFCTWRLSVKERGSDEWDEEGRNDGRERL